MKGKQYAAQEDLFGISKTQNLQQQVKELTVLIDKALKTNDYIKARELTAKQETLINELVTLGSDE